MKYSVIRKLKNDRTLYEKTYKLLNERIQLKIDEKLGLHGFTFDEVKVQNEKHPDRFTATFAELEELDKERTLVKKELDMINDYFNKIDRSIEEMNEVEKKVFKAKYLYGLSHAYIATKLDCSEKTIQRIIKDINEDKSVEEEIRENI
jgi:DNA-directed RNA polymerase specialized sigma subunit